MCIVQYLDALCGAIQMKLIVHITLQSLLVAKNPSYILPDIPIISIGTYYIFRKRARGRLRSCNK